MRALLLSMSLLILAGALLTEAHAGDEVYGTFTVVKGTVQVVSGKDHVARPARAGARVYPGDVIVTAADSRAKITMVDTNVLNISPDSKITIEKYEFNPQKSKKNVELSVDYGKLRSTVNQKYDEVDSKYHVKTPSAVAGVRGTDFLVSFDKATQASQVVTFRGRVEVGSGIDTTGHISSSVFVTKGQATQLIGSQPPTAPVLLPKQELMNMDKQSETNTSTSSSNSSGANRATASTNAKAPSAGTIPPSSMMGPGAIPISGNANSMAPTSNDMNNMAPPGDVGRAPASLSPLLLQNPISPPRITPIGVNPDIMKNGGNRLRINVR